MCDIDLRRYKVLAAIIFAFLSIAFAGSSSQAGWFGPSNYAECLLEKMKGQSLGMIEAAKAACKVEFPPPPEKPTEPVEALLDENNVSIKYNFCAGSDRTPLKICITDKPSNYNITKVIGHFSNEGSCTYLPDPHLPTPGYQSVSFADNPYEMYSNEWFAYERRWQASREVEFNNLVKLHAAYLGTFINIEGEKSYFFDDYSFNIVGSHSCAYVSFYGFSTGK